MKEMQIKLKMTIQMMIWKFLLKAFFPTGVSTVTGPQEVEASSNNPKYKWTKEKEITK